MSAPVLFVADLHLSDDTPVLNRLFADFLAAHQDTAAALYILGDLFEAWTGDDDDSETAAQVADGLRRFAGHAPVYFIAGNRDFMLGQRYASRAGLTLLPEHHLLAAAGGQTVLLTHGDEMCTDDTGYQRYRRIIRHPLVKALLRRLPFARRKRLAESIRAKSRARKRNGRNYLISDVTEAGVQATCSRYPAVDAVIHGHTHRPAVHRHNVCGRTVMRYVLPDWKDGQGGYLSLDDTGCIRSHLLPE